MARKNQYEIGIAADTSGLEKSISNGLVEPLEDAAKAFDKVENAAKGADLDREIDKAAKATDKLDDELDDTRDSLKRLGYAARDAGDDAHRGMNRAEDGVEEFGREAESTAKESAASFDGSAESILDAFQEVAANAFAGFGPAGAIAGLAIAAGIGIATQAFQDAEEAAEELRQKANEYANDAIDAGVSAQKWLTTSDQVVERIRELQDTKDNGFRLWFMEDPDELEKWTKALKDTGRATDDVEKVLSSSTDAVKDYRAATEDAYEATKREAAALIDRNKNDPVDGYREKVKEIRNQQEGYQDLLSVLDDEIQLREKSADAADRQKQAGVDGALARAQAEEDAASAIQSAQESVTESTLTAYDSMRSAAYEKATADDAAFDTEKWLTYVEKGRALANSYKDNIAAMKLTPAEWENFLALPEDARNNIAASYKKAGEDGKSRIRAALSDTGSTAGTDATVGFDDAFNPDATVTVDVNTAAAKRDLDQVSKKRTAEIEVKTTGKAKAKADVDALAKKRTATIEARLDTSAATRTLNAWFNRNNNRTITIHSRYVSRLGSENF